ncbi:beta strand repeat-containing protein, partial [Steroidobacter sp.]|uniref:beta strand repeat-containing protein n=1 Tax=Steroidobacter sp. TaxID=1978227 RepID=UPI001A521BAA
MTSSIRQHLRNPRTWRGAALLGIAAIAATIAQAAPPAGATIGNQASATYSDDSQVTRTVTSNTVITTVQQVASFTLSANGAKTATAGGQVFYPHTITNTGNGADTFALTSGQSGSFSFTTMQYYADANGDGVPDSNTAITSSGQVVAGGVFNFVAVGTVPSSVVVGNTNTLTVTATSGFNNTVSRANTDVTTITAQGVINVTHSIDVAVGPSPSVTSRTLTVTYTNTGNTTATNVTLADVIPSGFTYVAGSGRWSATGSTVLTDAAGGNQSGLTYDFGFTQSNRVTAVIDSVAPGASGTLTFQVNVNSGLPVGSNPATASTATYTYNDGSGTVPTANTNTAQYTVQQTASVQVNDSTVASAAQGGTVVFTNGVINTGNGADTFNLTFANNAFPAGTTFQLFKADGVTPVMDSNGDGIPDTGPMAASATLNIIVKATLPTGVHGGPYTIDLIGRSVLDSTKSDPGTDTLTAIGTSTVDLTNNTLGGPGVGAGPEGAAVITTPVAPGASATVTLVIANSSGLADTYNLSATTDGTLATTTLPAGWSIVFRDSNGNIVSNTGVVNANSNRTFTATVTAPANASTGFDVYFRALSPSTGSTDALHNAISVTAARSLVMSPNNTGQTTSGGTVTYTHTIVNTGNATEGDGSGSTVALSATSSSGFTSVIYWDRNNDTVLDANDPIITNLSQLVSGTNGASTAAGLSAGETARLFVKVTTAPGAAIGSTDTTTLTATTTGVIGGIAAPTAVSVTDTTSVVASQVTLVKMQALDQTCDGIADTAYSATNIGLGAAPGGCIRYQITATNGGSTA